jgi:hypothetical protein
MIRVACGMGPRELQLSKAKIARLRHRCHFQPGIMRRQSDRSRRCQ